MSRHPQRDDIQLLRGLAVIAVMLFHVDFWWIPGGFLGVDIFFVISGFVITQKIMSELEVGSFTLGEFYLKRIRRILPAAGATILAVLMAGATLMPTEDFRALGVHAIHAQSWLINFVFWQEAGYFDADSHQKPLLHLWSLSVEEQFYIVWPVLMMAAFRWTGRYTRGVIILVGLASLAAAELMRGADPAQAFFLTPYRAFQFAAGAIVYFITVPGTLRDLGFALGILLMGSSVVLLTAGHPMPGLLSLLPVAGAMACIACGDSPAGRLATIPPLKYAGDISYSLYLAHWPPVVFWRIWAIKNDALKLPEQLSLLGAGVALGLALHYLVEKPMRREAFWRGRPLRAAAAAGAFFASIYVGSTAWATDGWAWRLPKEVLDIASSATDLRDQRETIVAPYLSAPFPVEGNTNVVVIGDSHSIDVASALVQNGVTSIHRLAVAYRCQLAPGRPPIKAGNGTYFVSSEAAADQCVQDTKKVFDDRLLADASVVVIALRWKDWSAARLPETIKMLRLRTKAPIVVFGPTVEYRLFVPKIVERHGSLSGVDAYAANYENKSRRALNKKLAHRAQKLGLLYVDKFAVFCGSKPCPIIVPDTKNATIFDYGHWSVAGARLFGQRLRESGHPANVILFSGSPASAATPVALDQSPGQFVPEGSRYRSLGPTQGVVHTRARTLSDATHFSLSCFSPAPMQRRTVGSCKTASPRGALSQDLGAG